MPVDLKQLSGLLNSDDSPDHFPATHHRMAFNMRFRGNGNNLRGENIPGTTLINNDYLPTGTNECIGSFYDGLRQRLIWANYNSLSKNGWYQVNLKTGVVSRLLESFINSQTDIFNFSPDFPIPSVVMLYRTEEEGDELHWTDRRNRPMKMNLKDALDNTYGSNWIVDYLTVARTTPPQPPICSYANDVTVTINNLRRKLYQFRYRYVYKDLTKSTWSSYGKLFSPANPDDLADDINPQKNNRIDVTIQAGNADVIKVEISARQSITNTFSDCFLVATLDKALLVIPDNSLYTFKFYNDSSYFYVDVNENNLLFSSVPQKANTMELLNGNVIIYGATTEGYTFSETLNITTAVSLIQNTGSVPLYILEYQLGRSWGDMFLGGPQAGDFITLDFLITHEDGTTDTATFTYLVLLGNTLSTIQAAFIALIDADPNLQAVAISDSNGTTGVRTTSTNPTDIVTGTSSISYATTPTLYDVNIAMYHHLSKYRFGIVYFDEFDETNGVVTTASMNIETPEVDTTSQTQMKIPQITFSINSQPPIWAVKYSIVVTNSLTYGATLTTVSSNTAKDTDYGYLDITAQNTNLNDYPVYDLVKGDRARITGKFGGAVQVVDVPIVDLITNAATTPPGVGQWLKIPYSAATMSVFGTVGNEHFTVEIYTPALNTTPDLQVFWEIGEEYPVLFPGETNRAHGGKSQNQIVGVGAQPAIIELNRGDFYIRTRKIPFADNLSDIRTVWITDHSLSDLYPSNVRNNGRAYIEDKNARNQFYPTRLRWGKDYQQNTDINQTNIFYPLNADEIDRSKGAIQRLLTEDRLLYVYQNRGVGSFGVYSKYIQNNQGQSQLVTTDDIITSNNINYLVGEYGLGEQYCGLVRGRNVHYFADPVRGYLVRRAQDGLKPVSELYKGQFFIQPLLPPYNKDYLTINGSLSKILGAYDFAEEQWIVALQGGTLGIDRINPYTFSFNEKRNAFCSFYNFHPEWITSAEDFVYSWLNGNLYIHNNESKGKWTTFYGKRYQSSITLVFNKDTAVKKTFQAIAYQTQGTNKWICPEVDSIETNQTNPQTGLKQISRLKEWSFQPQESVMYAHFLRDSNSRADYLSALNAGDYLKGSIIQVTLVYEGNDFSYIYVPYVLYSISQRNF